VRPRPGPLLLASALSACVASHRLSEPPVPNGQPTPHPGPTAPVAPVAPVASAASAAAGQVLELPRGERTIFPTYQLVGFCGTPGAPALGELQGNLVAKAKTLETYASKYAVRARKIMPVFELIAVVVQGVPGPDGKYRHRVDDSVVDLYLQAARRSKALLLLNIQPGQSDFPIEVEHFEKYLHEPDVGIALDPEWAVKPKQRPGQYYGQTTGETINEVAAYLSAIVQQGGLPEKALVFHEVNRLVVKDESVVKPYPGVVVIKSVDGLGPKHAKIDTYGNLMEIITPGVHPGFKLFFDEDRRIGGQLMTPAEVLALLPPPEYVMYE
jgi:hypothetical protein